MLSRASRTVAVVAGGADIFVDLGHLSVAESSTHEGRAYYSFFSSLSLELNLVAPLSISLKPWACRRFGSCANSDNGLHEERLEMLVRCINDINGLLILLPEIEVAIYLESIPMERRDEEANGVH